MIYLSNVTWIHDLAEQWTSKVKRQYDDWWQCDDSMGKERVNEAINDAKLKCPRVNTSIIVYLWEFLLIWMCYNRNLLNWFRTFYMFMYTHMTCYLSATIYLKPHGYPRPFNTALEKVLNTVQCSSIQVRLWFC